MRRETLPGPALIAASPDFTARAAEVNTCGIVRVGCHRLPLDGEPGLRPRQSGRVALPGFAAIDRAVHGRLASGRHPRPNAGSVHREYPERIRITRMQDHWKSDRADALGHRRADVLPAFGWTIEAIDAAVILLIETIRQRRVHPHAMRVVTVFGVGIGQKVRPHAPIERPPICAAVVRFEHASAGHPDIYVFGIARIDQHRMQLGPVGRCVLVAATPRLALRMVVESVDAAPRGTSVFGAEQSLR